MSDPLANAGARRVASPPPTPDAPSEPSGGGGFWSKVKSFFGGKKLDNKGVAGTAAEAARSGAVNGGGAVLGATGSAVGAIGSGTLDATKTIAGKGLSGVGSFMKAGGGLAASAAKGGVKAAGGIWDGATSAASSAVEAGDAAGDAISGASSKAAGGIWGATKGFVGEQGEAIKNDWSDWDCDASKAVNKWSEGGGWGKKILGGIANFGIKGAQLLGKTAKTVGRGLAAGAAGIGGGLAAGAVGGGGAALGLGAKAGGRALAGGALLGGGLAAGGAALGGGLAAAGIGAGTLAGGAIGAGGVLGAAGVTGAAGGAAALGTGIVGGTAGLAAGALGGTAGLIGGAAGRAGQQIWDRMGETANDGVSADEVGALPGAGERLVGDHDVAAKQVGKYGGVLAGGAVGGITPELVSGGASLGGGVGGTYAGALGLVDGGLTLANAYSREKQAKAAGDKGGLAIADDSKSAAANGMVASAVSAGKGAVDIATVAEHGSKGINTYSNFASGAAAASSALSVAGAATGIAGGAIGLAQGGYHGVKALHTLYKSGKTTVLTAKGKEWKERLQNRQKLKATVQGLKVAGAVLGIVAGAMILASNPVGWAIGLAAAAVGGAIAIGKIANSVKNAWDRRKARKDAAKKQGGGPSSAEDASSPVQQEAERQLEDHAPEAEAEQGGPDRAKDARRKQIREKADEVVREVSTNARCAGEMRDAMKGDAASLEAKDAVAILKLMGVGVDEALSESGQELIEKRFSALNGL